MGESSIESQLAGLQIAEPLSLEQPFEESDFEESSSEEPPSEEPPSEDPPFEEPPSQEPPSEESSSTKLALVDHTSSSLLKPVAEASFRYRVNTKEILLGGSIPPSCDETNILTQRYDPRTNCSCNGLYPVPHGASAEQALQLSSCHAITRMVEIANLVNKKESERKPRDLFTAAHLQEAVSEYLLSNAEEQPRPKTCLGPMHSLANIQAPDRRPSSASCDTEPSVYHQLYPTNEQIKLLSDAKYFFAIACGGGFCDEGLAKAVAESANNMLIADYSDAADERSLFLLQEVGAAATAFLKLCNLAGFGVLGYYRDHSRSRRPGGVYGSRMTGVPSHRYIDLAIYVGVMNASIGLGEEITREQYNLLAEACCYIGDLIDFRSDTMRKLRENVALRGIKGNLCKYLDGLISSCLQLSAKAIKFSPVSALVVMGFTNWAPMSSQHKVYEVLHGVWEGRGGAKCEYVSASDGSYQQLLEALAGYGTLGDNGPSVSKRRADMDLLYYGYRTSWETHTAWLANCARSLLEPVTLRKDR
ncbi:hypothetical protein VE02_09167 [Pseudogymnoascus sp. 03VT05]|nr:hypothetical protein VE02_09167 [Pseudogymnoascus sp. 03VT05]